jgi:DNA-binding XRE family transcriptional regulator
MGAEMAFKDRLRTLRDAAGMTQEGLARAADLSASTVAKLERGPLDPHWATALALADALGASLDDFRDKADAAKPKRKGRRPS